MENKFVKLYAAYRSGCLGDNIFHVYYPFFANIIFEENWDTIDETKVAKKFEIKYDTPMSVNFIRQVLGIGVEKHEIVYIKGVYYAERDKLKSYSIDNSGFDSDWKCMIEKFCSFCQSENFNLSEIDVEAFVLRFLDAYDEAILSNDEIIIPERSSSFNYAWYRYLKVLSEKEIKIFNFIVALSFSNILKEAVFYTSDTANAIDTYNGLNLYLDSPIVFALLGIDSPARIDSCKMLITEMQKAGCSVYIFDHNFEEIRGIMERAAGWATSVDYDIQKANNVARFFHDKLIEAPIISEFCEMVETKLNEQGVTIRKTTYDFSKNEFQEDEQKLFSMIEDKYRETGLSLLDDRKRSILIDIRSIIMVYRERYGRTSTKIQTSGHLFITLNGTIANVCKNYESNVSINAGYIPACVSGDIFGSVLWLFTPTTKIEYQRKQLLADCYVALQPSKEMLSKYIDTLNRAYKADEIDEKKFLFLRSHMAVNDALMNITRGDYARFNDLTYQEVYDEIVATVDKKYIDEAVAHDDTKKQLKDRETENIQLNEKINDLQSRLDLREKVDFNYKCNKWGWVITFMMIGIPYFFLITMIEIFKGAYNKLSIASFIHIGILVLTTFIAGLIFVKIKKLIFSQVRKYLSKNRITKTNMKL